MARLFRSVICRRLLFTLIPWLTCMTLEAGDHVPTTCCGAQHVFLFRGGVGYWPNLRSLDEQLNARGFRTSIHFPCEFVGLPGKIEQQLKAGQLSQPLVFVGYSSGADAVCIVSKRLQERGIPVQTAILVEPTMGINIPGNVQYCRNFYKSSPMTDWIPAFRGIAIAREDSRTRLENLDARCHPALFDLQEKNHFSIAAAPALHCRIANLVVARHAATMPLWTAPPLETPPATITWDDEEDLWDEGVEIIPASNRFQWSRSESVKR